MPVVVDGGRVPGPLHGHEKEEGGSVIKAGKLRGVESDGMLCGPQELGWDDKVAPLHLEGRHLDPAGGIYAGHGHS